MGALARLDGLEGVATMLLAPFSDSTSLLQHPDCLRRRADEDGFLYFAGLLDGDLVGTVARSVHQYAHKVGWLEPAALADEGRVAPGKRVGDSKDPDWVGLQVHLQTDPSMRALGESSSILRAVRAAEGYSRGVTLSMANICRVFSPHPDMATPPHQDGHFVRDLGDFWTAWVPVIDCPRALGPIALLPGSHQCGLWNHSDEGIASDAGRLNEGTVWHSADVRRGDLVLFRPHTVHCALPNLSPDRLRVSVDFRYVVTAARAVA